MSDLISRQAAIDALADMHCKSDEDGYVWIIRSDAWARIDALPSAEPEPKWIPVSERLPKSRTYCLFTVFEHDSELEATTIETVYGRFDDYGEQRYCSWEDEFGECCIEGEEQLDGDHDEIIEKVLAWMPLPEPYKERRTDE